MANGYDNTNDGAVFPNDKKRGPNSPNLTGSSCIQCPHCGKKSDFWVSAWKKISKGGKQFLSLAYNPKEERPQQSGQQNIEPPIDFDDDLPF